MSNVKDILTTIIAIAVVVTQAISAYLQSTTGDINWIQMVLAIGVALVAYFTGKNGDGTTKKTPTKV